MYKFKLFFLAISLAFIALSCEREYTPPPLNEPIYEGQRENTTIKDLRSKFASITDPTLIDENLVLRVVVVGNDESGNIYKQMYVEDASGGINIGIDQNSMYTTYQVGQELYIHLKDLYMVKYGGELQIGMDKTNANRISWETFKLHAFANSWPSIEKATPTEITLGNLSSDMVNRLVVIKNVRFVNGGKKAFTDGERTTNESIRSADGNFLDVRSSNFSNFAKNMLPTGSGTVVGMLGRFNGGWQLFLRTIDDVRDFDGSEEDEEGEPAQEGVFFKETFGEGFYPSGNRPKIGEFTEFDMKAPIRYSDASGLADIRSIAGGNAAHIWMPANKDSGVKIEGINSTGKGEVTLSFQLAANLFEAGQTANFTDIELRIQGRTVAMPSQVLSNPDDHGKFYTIKIANIAQEENLTIEFISSADKNKMGFRLDTIELIGGDGGGGDDDGPIIVNPNK